MLVYKKNKHKENKGARIDRLMVHVSVVRHTCVYTCMIDVKQLNQSDGTVAKSTQKLAGTNALHALLA